MVSEDREPPQDEEVAAAVEAAIQARGGAVAAHLLFQSAPELRKMLADRRLLRFLRCFPDRFEIADGSPREPAEIRTRRPLPPGGVAVDDAQPHVVCARRLLAESVWAALIKHGSRSCPGLADGAAREPGPTPLPWLVRDKAVRQRLQGLLVVRPSLPLLHHRDAALVAELGRSGAWWATLAAHLEAFLAEWPVDQATLPAPELVEEPHLPCMVEAGTSAGRLRELGYRCPCRVHVAVRAKPAAPGAGTGADSGHADKELAARLLLLLDGSSAPLDRVGKDPRVQRLLRQSRWAGDCRGLLAWLRERPELFCLSPAATGQLLVAPAGAGHATGPRRGAAAPRRKPARRPQAADGGSDSEGLPSCSASGWSGDPSRQCLGPVVVLGEAPGVIAVLKEAGVTTEQLLARLRAQLLDAGADGEVASVSRLDRMTSGVLVAARGGATAFLAVKAQFAGRSVQKEYLALCGGEPLGPPGSEGEVSRRLLLGRGQYRAFVSPKGKEARTLYRVLAAHRHPLAGPGLGGDELGPALGRLALAGGPRRTLSLLRVQPVTGRTHQIRAHLAHLGRPLVADLKYSPRRGRQDLLWCPRLFLHCARVELRDLEGAPFVALAPLPEDLRRTLRALPLAGSGGQGGGAGAAPAGAEEVDASEGACRECAGEADGGLYTARD
ncbi:unnamed protein product [Prorocentrum cordatum]|uniref:Pseudouridine synthase RsuA/RluA-like domain-containing protein n=1 Tax=Prorocentrum cordatum TaxID=2364126 RepID=A0ABN9X8H6_9DINO|nr:unnamed protein product [Polarella glacialis]